MRDRLHVLVAIVLTYTLQITLFLGVRSELAYTLHHALGGERSALPALTASFALPVLGPGGLEGTPGALFWVFWALVLLPPAVLAWRTWRDPDPDTVLRRFVYWGSTYGLGVAFGYLLVLVGVWLPFAAA